MTAPRRLIAVSDALLSRCHDRSWNLMFGLGRRGWVNPKVG